MILHPDKYTTKQELANFNHKLNDKSKILWYSIFRNQEQHFAERNSVMKASTSTIRNMSERQAIFQFEEHSFAKHAHFRDKQKFRYSMNA